MNVYENKYQITFFKSKGYIFFLLHCTIYSTVEMPLPPKRKNRRKLIPSCHIISWIFKTLPKLGLAYDVINLTQLKAQCDRFCPMNQSSEIQMSKLKYLSHFWLVLFRFTLKVAFILNKLTVDVLFFKCSPDSWEL